MMVRKARRTPRPGLGLRSMAGYTCHGSLDWRGGPTRFIGEWRCHLTGTTMLGDTGCHPTSTTVLGECDPRRGGQRPCVLRGPCNQVVKGVLRSRSTSGYQEALRSKGALHSQQVIEGPLRSRSASRNSSSARFHACALPATMSRAALPAGGMYPFGQEIRLQGSCPRRSSSLCSG